MKKIRYNVDERVPNSVLKATGLMACFGFSDKMIIQPEILANRYCQLLSYEETYYRKTKMHLRPYIHDPKLPIILNYMGCIKKNY